MLILLRHCSDRFNNFLPEFNSTFEYLNFLLEIYFIFTELRRSFEHIPYAIWIVLVALLLHEQTRNDGTNSIFSQEHIP